MNVEKLIANEEKRLIGIQKYFASKTPHELIQMMKAKGKKGGTNRWANLSVKQRLDVIKKLNQARKESRIKKYVDPIRT